MMDAAECCSTTKNAFPDFQSSILTTLSLQSPGSSSSETSDYQQSVSSPTNELDPQNDSGIWENPDVFGDEGFSEPHHPQKIRESNEQFSGSFRSTKNDEVVFEVPLPPGGKNFKRLGLYSCSWVDCLEMFPTSDALFNHMKTIHVVQIGSREGIYKCFWKGCKVYGKGSATKYWLEKHVAQHCGRKPFACIFDGCQKSLSTMQLLQRHVNHHLKPSLSQHLTNKSTPTTNKINSERFGQLIGTQKTTRKFFHASRNPSNCQYFLPRMFDYFDEKSFYNVHDNMLRLEAHQVNLIKAGILLDNGAGMLNILDQTIVFRGVIKGRRRTKNGEEDVLLAWNPANLICDEWVPRKNLKQTKCVKVRYLSFEEREKTIEFILNKSRQKFRRSRKVPKNINKFSKENV